MIEDEEDKSVTVVNVTDGAEPTTVRLKGIDQHGNRVEETLTLMGSETVVSEHSYRSLGGEDDDLSHCHYESHEEAWESGYSAALHDFECYLLDSRPWWAPRWLWRNVAGALERAYRKRGSDL